MASTFVNNLRLTELGTGDASGTWGNTTNTNLEIIGEALGYGTRAIANASTDNITIADGALDVDRSLYLKLTGGGQACTVTLLPNTVSKVWIMENNTNSTLTFTQGSGANVAILAGQTKAIATDGAGSGAIVYEVFTDLNLAGTTNINNAQVDGGINIAGSITSASNGNIAITPNGSGKVILDGISHPTSDGSNGQVLQTNGSGVLSFATIDLSTKANINSPTFTGTPLAPTAGASVNNTQLATTAYVTTAIGNADAFPQGTSMLFQQTSAPTGWTKQTTHNDKALRLTSGTVGTGGSVAFSTAFGTGATVAGGSVSGTPGSNQAVAVGNLAVSVSGSISNTTISTSTMPSHTHSFTGIGSGNSGAASFNAAGTQANSGTGTFNTNATGSGGAHTHAHSLSGSLSGAPTLSGSVTAGNLAVGASTAAINVSYVDFIIANKD